MKNRYIVLMIVALTVFVGLVILTFSSLDKDEEQAYESVDFSTLVESKPLPIPPLLEDVNPDPNQAEFHLTAQHGTSEILDGIESETLGYNGDLLGPIIRVHEGEQVKVKMKNELDEVTTLHWHGLRIDGKYDGGPHSGIMPGETWEPKFTVEQPAATLWYHPHMMEMTAEQVYEGLTGLFYIEDEVSDSLNIPKEHGVNDFPLIVQDRLIDETGDMKYTPTLTDSMRGLFGNVSLINGAISPYLEVPNGLVRFRVINGSNARTYDFSLDNHQPFYQIASDGGFLEKPIEMESIQVSPAERAEILVDFSQVEPGEKISLINNTAELENTTPDTTDKEDTIVELMEFVVTDEASEGHEIPEHLTTIERSDPETSVQTREFVMSGVGSRLTINDKVMDMNVVDEVVDVNTTEIWEVSNLRSGEKGGMAHPFHLHGVQFQVLDRDGNPPPENETGWKDTVLVQPGEKIRIIAEFRHKGLFMYHCHILEHEDAGMMGQYEVQ